MTNTNSTNSNNATANTKQEFDPRKLEYTPIANTDENGELIKNMAVTLNAIMIEAYRAYERLMYVAEEQRGIGGNYRDIERETRNIKSNLQYLLNLFQRLEPASEEHPAYTTRDDVLTHMPFTIVPPQTIEARTRFFRPERNAD